MFFFTRCVVPKTIHTPPPPTGGAFALSPPSPWNFRNYSTWFGTLWKEYLCKEKVVALYFYAKDNFFSVRGRPFNSWGEGACRKKKVACSTNVIESLWEKREKKHPAHQIARKKILDDQKSALPHPLRTFLANN